jgi:FtsH-binding integral membrane protein
MATNKSFIEELGSLVVHVVLAMFVSLAAGVVVSALIGSTLGRMGGTLLPASLSRLLFDVPYSPLVWGAALLLGFLVNRRMQSRSACWVGVIGVLALVLLVRWDVSSLEKSEYYRNYTKGHYWEYERDRLFAIDPNKCGGSECWENCFLQRRH